MYYFRTIAGWIIHCVIQFVLLWAPFVNPQPENSYPPGWWYELWGYSDWRDNLDSQNRPNSTLLALYWECCWWHMRLRVDNIADAMIRGLRSYLLDIIGTIQSGFNSLGNWVSAISGRLGEVLPFWAANVMAGLWNLFRKLPWAIQYGLSTWADIWEGIKREVREWAITFFTNTMKFALDAWAWVAGWGGLIRTWWQSYQLWLANLVVNTYAVIGEALGSTWFGLEAFWQDPAGHIAGWLGPSWQSLVTFARDCLTFYYNIWGTHADTLSSFLASPLDYLYDRAETFIEQKLG